MKAEITTYVDTLVGKYTDANVTVKLNTNNSEADIRVHGWSVTIYGKYNTLSLRFDKNEIELIDKLIEALNKIKHDILDTLLSIEFGEDEFEYEEQEEPTVAEFWQMIDEDYSYMSELGIEDEDP